MQQSWEIPFPHITRHPWPSPGHPLPSNNSGRMLACENYFPPFRIPTQGSLRLYFVRIFYLAYIIIILLAGSKSVYTKISEIIYIYNTSLWGTSDATDPANRGLERAIIELTTLDFRPGTERALPARRADRSDRSRTSFLGTHGSPARIRTHSLLRS